MRKPIRSIEEFFAHALAIEHEAAERYREFQAHFAGRGDEAIAKLCGNLAGLEQEHYEILAQRCRGCTLPAIDAQIHRWLESDAPELPSREFVYRVATPRQLLEIALKAELAARGFFDWIAQTTPDPAVRTLAEEMAREEDDHVHWVTEVLDYVPRPAVDWDRELAGGSGPGLALGGERRSQGDRGPGH